jgi:hypothetical protein
MNYAAWSELEEQLVVAWREVVDRGGTFADAPCEIASGFEDSLDPVYPLEKAAHQAIDTWITSGNIPSMPPAANRYAEIQLICAIGLIRRLAELSSVKSPKGWSRERALRWLLFDVHADTVQVALDNMRMDLLGGKT